MIIREKNMLKAEQTALINLTEGAISNNSAGYYMELLGLSYHNNNANLIPSRFKWGSSLIKVVD